jgi:hypothetical protein
MGRACNRHGGNDKLMQNFTRNGKKFHLGDRSIYGKIILKWLLQKQDVRFWSQGPGFHYLNAT